MALFARDVRELSNGRLPLLGFVAFLTACAPRRFLVATSSFDHATRRNDRSGEMGLPRRRTRPSKPEPREWGTDLMYYTGQGSFWFRQYSREDRGTFPPLLRRDTSNSYVARTP